METYVQTTSLVNYNKGIFSLYFVSQNQQQMAKGIATENDNELELKQVIHMPASGFMYMVSMVKNMLEDPRMQQEIENMMNANLLPTGCNEERNEEGQLVIESNGEKNKK
ncbi:TPA: peptide chain release factor 1 [Yersinia enterocolitica]